MHKHTTCSKIPWFRERQETGRNSVQNCTGLHMGQMQKWHQVHSQNLNNAVLAVCRNCLDLHQAQHLEFLACFTGHNGKE
uniref:Uncharacterized protein n=1 Tax=Arundo donax TaxID=35708 RepID=A0A0A9D9D2_ARUDO